MSDDRQDLTTVLAEIAHVAQPHAREGNVANYIPALATANPDHFGIALVDMHGSHHAVGDVDVDFPIQSISKVFALLLAMRMIDERGELADELWSRVGREPSGDPFNSLVQLEHERGVPRNPMINAGALVVHDILMTHCGDAKQAMIDLLSTLAATPVSINEEVYESELSGPHRNRAMANLLKDFGNLDHSVDEVLDDYVYACSIEMTARQLATAVRCLANGGIDPASGERIISAPRARRIAAIMLTCGTYDAAGEFAFSVGLPSKSGVAGGIISTVPGRYGACVWSPPLDPTGNSLAGRIALHELAERLELSVM